ncbi:hypothetical protein JOL79_06700 [Microbispora sp. RL4-1S]|uniref:Uncharacterized protein n=1 Tax=Microbispora oryzae TaxID=2806554 RepID=A0A940WDK4_9ACTN|nr:hypothetical protein [Microbispora oryzae]MBP2703486.1 hypothetical protein [Microbispora oryzae]
MRPRLPRDGVGRDLAAAFAELDLSVDYPDGTGAHHVLDWQAATFHLDTAREAGALTWAEQVREAVAMMLTRDDEGELRAELLRSAALLLGWLYCLDRRASMARPIRLPRASSRLRRQARSR